ncbi:MAG: amino acid ABC transporter permease [Oscillospiraceae bacterium]|nr:amino acid ABC transporter permease [Oscillospiraceae bacterium]
MQKYWQVFLLQGVSYTLLLSLLTVAFGAVLGLLLYLGRSVRFKPLNWLCIAIVEIIRGTPMLLQLYVGYFIVPKILPFPVTEFASVAVALCINSGCYVSEIFRSGIQAVDRGQTEAARSLGLNSRQTMMRIILPQAIKNILPALGNEFIMIIKDTSLASTFFVGELMTACLKVRGNTFLALECMTIVGVIYFVLTFILSKLLGAFERRLKAHD